MSVNHHLVAGIAGVSLSACALCQVDGATQQGLAHKAKSAASSLSGSPATEAETRTIILRVERLVREVTGSKAQVGSVAIPSSGRLVDRNEVIAEFWRLYRMTSPKFKVTPRRIDLDEKVVQVWPRLRSEADELIRIGAVANYGPLAAGPGSSLTLFQLGDAVGFFVARMAEMTYTPSEKWDPLLNGNG
jgi:hypothetical protein